MFIIIFITYLINIYNNRPTYYLGTIILHKLLTLMSSALRFYVVPTTHKSS